MNIVQLLASSFFGGPERQVLQLAQHLPADYRTTFLSFSEGGRAGDFLQRVAAAGYDAVELRENWPHVPRTVAEVAEHLRRLEADIVCTNGYKPDLVGWLAARRVGTPLVAIAHGWTGATWKVRLNEMVDRQVLRYFNRVIGVSEAQSEKLRRAGVRPQLVATIPNAIVASGWDRKCDSGRERLEAYFAKPPRLIVVAAGRLSPEKGFDHLIAAAARLASRCPDVGFLLFGGGPLRADLERLIERNKLQAHFVLGGFRDDLDLLLPHADVMALSSLTEGLPVIVLEALAAELPVVATKVGGVPEVIQHEKQGLLVEPGDAAGLAEQIGRLLDDGELRTRLAAQGRRCVVEQFSCELQSRRYQAVFQELCRKQRPVLQNSM